MKGPTRLLLIAALALIPLLGIALVAGAVAGESLANWLSAGLILGMGYALKDADAGMVKTAALPNGAATTQIAGIDLGIGSKGDCGGNFELQIEAPALATADLGDGATMKYDVYHDTASNFGSEALLMRDVVVQTGAGGAGAAAQTVRIRLPMDVNRYVRVKATNSAAGDASDKSMTVRLVF
jgi:hypothetical protein